MLRHCFCGSLGGQRTLIGNYRAIAGGIVRVLVSDLWNREMKDYFLVEEPSYKRYLDAASLVFVFVFL